MRWYSAFCLEVTVHQILIVITLVLDFSDLTLFPDNSSYSFHLIGLKHGNTMRWCRA